MWPPPLHCRQLEHTLGSWQWEAVILDESHKLATSRKLPDTQVTVVAQRVAARARRTVLLTGCA